MVETRAIATGRRRRATGRADDPLRRRAVIEGVRPEVDGGRFPAKATLGEDLVVEADIFTDGMDAIGAVVKYRKAGEEQWREAPMEPLDNDRWRASFAIAELSGYQFSLEAWIDEFATWRRDLSRRLEAGQDLTVEYQLGARIIEQAAGRASGKAATALLTAAARLSGRLRGRELWRLALDEHLASLMAAHPDRSLSTRYERELEVRVDAPRAGFGSWYEMFPRSTQAAAEPGRGKDGRTPKGVRHGGFRDVEAHLPHVAEMGFDVLYLPPIHPIGRTNRKGKNNAGKANAGEPGSPWAIGSEEGGHKAVHPQLGTLAEFRSLVGLARERHEIEIALDLAYQCSPDHPYVREHPEWFRQRPDSSIRHAENPPKKYEDIYPFDFNTADREGLWQELKSIVDFWIDQGVRIFRVDNPHTKPFAFWEWLIGEVKQWHPEVIFLAEAFTRPKVMYRLAKCGFCQSYTYFAWKNAKAELVDYMAELTRTPVRDFLRPNFWPNTPDILTEYLQEGGRAAFVARLVLAATLSANYGIYGPAFELMEHRARERGSEEYLNSEKYEIKRWDTGRADSLRDLISLVNAARRENPALQANSGLRFHRVTNEQLVCFSKQTNDAGNVVVVAVNLDYKHAQSGWVELPVAAWNLGAGAQYQLHDVLTGTRYTWSGSRNFVLLDPAVMPAHVFVLRRRKSSGWESE